MSKKVKRLFSEFIPENYDLYLDINREKAKFAGKVTIRGQKVSRPNKRITFHQSGLKAISAKIIKHNKKDNSEFTVSRINNHDSFDEMRIHSGELLHPGSYTIEIEFSGKITPQMNGIYPCNFKINGKNKQLIATQFESHHAREVFPCIDEPEAKATFDLSITSPKGETVIANTPVKSQKTEKNLVTSIFETTPIMPTYLLAFVYGELEFKEAKTNDGVIVRTYATPENARFTDFALQVAVQCLNFYNEYFDIPYPLEKCDMIALPDFASGAMENWGCITYREQCMLVDPNNTSVSTKQYVAMVVAHELAHQWFGNLVTMRWWTDLWLNEGFASWIEYMAIDHIFPEWQMWTQFAVDEQHRAFKLDALENTHAIEVPIHHPDEIRSIFDTISYSKGASVLHMLHAYLGAKDFRDGLRHYLRKHEYGNTDTVDLWEALEHISKKPVRQFMDSWTTQSGFPIISIDTSNTKTTISQERFFINPKHDKSPKTLWPISLQANVKDLPEIMDETSISINGHMTSLKLNQSQTGFYRVDYDIEQLAEFGKLVKSAKLTPIDRLGILSDAFESAKAGFTPTIEVFKFLDYFGDEDNNAVWDVIATGIGATRTVMDDEQLREDMKSYIASLTSKQYKRLGWKQLDNENYFDTLLRPTILGLSTGADVSEAVNTALELFDKSKTIDNIEPDLRSLILATAVRLRNDNKTFDKLFNMYQSSNLSEEKTVLAAALSSFKSPRLYKKALGIIKTDHVRPQDISYWVVYSFSNRFAKRETWEWMTKNWKWLEKIIGNDLSFYRFPLYAANAFSDDKFIPIYKKFFAKYNSSALDRSIKQGVETLEWQSEWKKRDIQSIKQFFTMK